MSKDKLVCSFEQAKEIKELGIVQGKSAYEWIHFEKTGPGENKVTKKLYDNPFGETFYKATVKQALKEISYNWYSAFTVTEFAVMIKSGSKGADTFGEMVRKHVARGNSIVSTFMPDFMAARFIELLKTNICRPLNCNFNLSTFFDCK